MEGSGNTRNHIWAFLEYLFLDIQRLYWSVRIEQGDLVAVVYQVSCDKIWGKQGEEAEMRSMRQLPSGDAFF